MWDLQTLHKLNQDAQDRYDREHPLEAEMRKLIDHEPLTTDQVSILADLDQ